MATTRFSRLRVPMALLLVLSVSGCGREGVGAGFLMGDAATGCVWGEEVAGDRFEIALPPGWTAAVAPVEVIDDDGEVFVRERENLAGTEVGFPWERSGEVVCEIEEAVATVRFTQMAPPTSHMDHERRG